MIYLVTSERYLFNSEKIQIITVEESLKKLETLSIVGLDTETSGLSAWSDNLLLCQLGCKDFQVVIDCRTIDITLYKDYLESDRLFLGWNLKFDLQWLYKYSIIPQQVYDGMLAEKLMWLGYPNGMHSLSLKSAGENYLGIELDKSVRGKIIWSKTLTEDIIVYAAEDVAYLEDIYNKQQELLKEKELLVATDIENKFVLPLAYTEWCGIKLDVDKWKAKMLKDKQREKEALDKCNKWLLENEPNSPYIFIDRQGDLFNGFNLEPQISLNWNSAKQVGPIFKKYGVNIEVEDREKGGTKDSIDAKCLKPQKDKCNLIPLYLEYKEAVKVTSTYGQNFLDQVNPTNGRIKSKFNQLGTDTGRLSSGGKDGNFEYINFQNLPADEETRACFVAENVNSWVSIDYSGEESFLMASIANDKAMIDELTFGDKDLHTLTAKLIFDYIPKSASAKEVKTKFHKERSVSKGYEFAFNYMGDASTIQRNFGLSENEAKRIYNAYMDGFKGLKLYQEFRKKDWWDKGYILINELTGHKAFIYDYDKLVTLKKSFTPEFWELYKAIPRDPITNKKSPRNLMEEEMCSNVSHFFKRHSASSHQSGNYPIQGTGAIIFKLATINFFNWICKNNLFNKVKLCIPVHDEWNIEAPKEIAEEVVKRLHQDMVDAGAIFCTRCKLDAEISRLEDGSLPNYWIHK